VNKTAGKALAMGVIPAKIQFIHNLEPGSIKYHIYLVFIYINNLHYLESV
jgi:hypothetical protein